ncbi:acetate/propionate family kinase [Sandaracinus amylolyticus]|uniref:Acetate kinase n=1 Tax=Sandaracinus amylolyticus TaxID=927083 RepID=A0A0F6WAV8_9BACT|nr:acetate/propionate family kinase [Sandaracinus amylolyticus]AKF11771.1 Acetate kinase [Sandaracinus amylolyticus]
MRVLVVNVGSTSVKYNLYEMDTEARLAAGRVERVGTADATHIHEGGSDRIDGRDVTGALRAILAHLTREGGPLPDPTALAAVGHRVVHGGEQLVTPTPVDERAERIIEECAAYAPLHNPVNLAGIRAARAVFSQVPHVAVFDTAFHAQLPPHAYSYAIPHELYLEKGIRRYGFHGPSHQYMALSAAEHLGTHLSRLKLITCHLGGGASVSAIEHGVSVETSMGMTPLEGLVMGTRAGDLDPAIPMLLAKQGMAAGDIDELLNRRSGLAGLSGIGADFRDIQQAAEGGDPRARLAIEVFVHRLRKYVGAYAATLGGADAIVFTGGIGENSALVRSKVCEGLIFMGVALDERANETKRAADHGGIVEISAHRAPTKVLVVRTDEERMIAREVMRCVVGPTATIRSVRARPIPVGVSVRHVHLSRADCDALFGPGYELTKKRDVTQPGQYVTRETVDLVGPKGEIRRVAIINPLRKQTQVEVARTDAITLGVSPPLRESGKLEGTPGLTLRGPAGSVEIPSGVILAHRHVHMSPDEARDFGVNDRDVIKVRVDGDREMTMGDVIVRVHPEFTLDMHVDTDEANAAGLTSDSVVAFEGVQEPRE